MELLEFKNKILVLCGVNNCDDVGKRLMTAVLSNDIKRQLFVMIAVKITGK